VTAPVVAGTPYIIRVASFGSTPAEGTFDLNISCAPTPSNDECAGAIPIVDGTTTGLSNVGATLSGGAPALCSPGAQRDVWFSYAASCTGTLLVTTCGGGTLNDTVLQVLGGTCASPVSLACNNNDCGFRSALLVPVSAGTTYLLRVASTGLSVLNEGTFDLNVTCLPPAANDECAAALPISEGTTTGLSNVGATNSLGAPAFCAPVAGSDVWFAYTPSCTGTAVVQTCNGAGTLGDTVVQALTGGCAAPTVVACNNNSCGFLSYLTFPVTAGTAHLLRVASVGSGVLNQGTFDLSVTCCLPLPNDECAGAAPVFFGLNSGFDTTCATDSPLPYACGTAGGKDLWYAYTAPCSGPTRFALCSPGSSSFDALLEVYGGTCGAPALLACNDDACGVFSPEVTVPTTLGATYFVRVAGEGAASGAFSLSISNVGGSGTFSTLPTGCGGPTLVPSGSPTPGGSVAYAQGSAPGTPLLWLGLPAPVTPLCPPAPCALGAPLLIVLFGSSFSADIPCDPLMVGAVVWVQGGRVFGTGGCDASLFGAAFALTGTVVTTIG
jgi:hypothetical protein